MTEASDTVFACFSSVIFSSASRLFTICATRRRVTGGRTYFATVLGTMCTPQRPRSRRGCGAGSLAAGAQSSDPSQTGE
jgi:hypothetical protein